MGFLTLIFCRPDELSLVCWLPILVDSAASLFAAVVEDMAKTGRGARASFVVAAPIPARGRRADSEFMEADRETGRVGVGLLPRMQT